MKKTELTLLILAVDDLPRAKQFYIEAFGWEMDVDEPVYVQFNLPNGMQVGLYTKSGFASNTNLQATVLSCGEEVTTGTELYLRTENLEGSIQRLQQAGAKQLAELETKPWGDDVAYFADPVGNVLAIAKQSGA
jgi:uncharacterized protein